MKALLLSVVEHVHYSVTRAAKTRNQMEYFCQRNMKHELKILIHNYFLYPDGAYLVLQIGQKLVMDSNAIATL